MLNAKVFIGWLNFIFSALIWLILRPISLLTEAIMLINENAYRRRVILFIIIFTGILCYLPASEGYDIMWHGIVNIPYVIRLYYVMYKFGKLKLWIFPVMAISLIFAMAILDHILVFFTSILRPIHQFSLLNSRGRCNIAINKLRIAYFYKSVGKERDIAEFKRRFHIYDANGNTLDG